MAQVAVLEGRNLIEHYVSRAGRRRQPDPRQHLRRAGAERAAGHGGGVRRHRHAQERRALPRRRAVRRRGHRGEATRGSRTSCAPAPADRLPGHEEPDRRQGRPPHPGGVAARSLRRADPQLQDLRHLQAPARRRAQAPAVDPRPGEAGRARPDRAHRRRARHRGRAARRHARCCSASGSRSPPRRPRPRQPALLYREPELAVRVIREEFNADYRSVVDRRPPPLRGACKAYIAAFNPELADRVEYYDPAAEGLSLFEHYHVHEQVHKALDRKVWLPSGGSLIIEHTEALTVIDVNTGKNVGTSSPRGDGVPQQPRGGRGDRQAAAPARHRRHHRHRLHRHGGAGPTARRSSRGSATPSPATRRARRCSTSPTSAWSR